MGTEISDSDISHIHALCDQIIAITTYRTQLAEYLRNRMNAIAPNLTALVGDLVGARLISHAGSLLSLAKHPASTVQILGAEKALFRALKTKHDTPKYGLIYHVGSNSYLNYFSSLMKLGLIDRSSTSKAEGKGNTTCPLFPSPQVSTNLTDGSYGGNESCVIDTCRCSHGR
jgi:hypothetical protein